MTARLLLFLSLALGLHGEGKLLTRGAQAVSILSRVKAATGGAQWDRVRFWHERGTYRLDDLQGTYETWLDFRHARSYFDVQFSSAALGLIRRTAGWNSRVSWSGDQTGDVCIADSEEARKSAVGDTYVSTFAYLFGNRFPAEMRVKSSKSTDGRQFEIVEVTPRGTDTFELWIDGSSMVRRIVQLKGVERAATSFSDFRLVNGLRVPFRSEESVEGGGVQASRVVTSIETDAAAPSRRFDPPQTMPGGVEFPEGRDSVTVDFRYADQQIFLPVSVNGKRQEKFVFDTGSENTIDTSRALALGLTVEKAGISFGGGPGAAPRGLTRVGRLEIGGLRLVNTIVQTTVMVSGPNDSIQGTVGYELAKRTVVSIDYAAKRITFTKPQVFREPDHGVAMPLRFADPSEVLVSASVDGVPGDFQLDTGAALQLLVERPFAERNGLLEKYGSGGRSAGAGVGGVMQTVLFQPDEFVVGRLRPRVTQGQISLAESGGYVEEHVAGAIGNGILEQFVVTLDYGRRRVYFEKTGHLRRWPVPQFGAEPR